MASCFGPVHSAQGCDCCAAQVTRKQRCCVLHRCVNMQVAAAAEALQLSAVCDQLGLAAAAAEWYRLAAPESCPSVEQQQQAAQSRRVQQVVLELLQAQTGSTQGQQPLAEQQRPLQGDAAAPGAFLVDALAGVDQHTMSSWLPDSTGGSGLDSGSCDKAASLNTWGSRVGSAQGGCRPSSAAAGAGMAAQLAGLSAGPPGGGQASSMQALQVSPVSALDSWVSIAQYLVDHAQYTAGQRLCSFALEQARWALCGEWRGHAELLCRLGVIHTPHEKLLQPTSLLLPCITQNQHAVQALLASPEACHPERLYGAAACMLCRPCGDSKSEAEVLLLQARLALLAQHYEEAVKLSQVCAAALPCQLSRQPQCDLCTSRKGSVGAGNTRMCPWHTCKQAHLHHYPLFFCCMVHRAAGCAGGGRRCAAVDGQRGVLCCGKGLHARQRSC